MVPVLRWSERDVVDLARGGADAQGVPETRYRTLAQDAVARTEPGGVQRNDDVELPQPDGVSSLPLILKSQCHTPNFQYTM